MADLFRRASVVFGALGASAYLAMGIFAQTTGGQTTRVSVASGDTTVEGNGPSVAASLSQDGRFVAFASTATNLVSADTNGVSDIFVYDQTLRTQARVSVAADGTQANGASSAPSASSDARYIAFVSSATNLVTGDTNAVDDVFIKDTQSGGVTRPTGVGSIQPLGGASHSPSLSSSGRYVALVSSAGNFVSGDLNGAADIFIFDREGGTSARVSVASDGTEANGASSSPAISADGRYVAFVSSATNLVSNDTNGVADIFLKDTTTGAISRLSVADNGTQADAASDDPAWSSDGSFVAFTSSATNLLGAGNDTNGVNDVYLFNRTTNTISRVNLTSSGAQGDGTSGQPSLSSTGRYVVFRSSAGNLVSDDTNDQPDVFVRDRAAGVTTRVSLTNDGAQANLSSASPAIASDGRYVGFDSDATNLVSGDTNGTTDVFVRRRCVFTVTPSSVAFMPAGGPGTVSLVTDSDCGWTATSNDSFITLTTSATGTGSSTIGFTVAANSGGQRTGTLTVGTETVTITQSSSSCTYAIDPTSAVFATGGGSGTVSLTTQADCAWTAASNSSFLTLTSAASGSGSATVSYTVSANGTGAMRTGTLTIAGLTFTVTQSIGVTLTVARAGSGSGTITTSPSGINCGTSCTATYDMDTVVTLVPRPAFDSNFAGWTGQADCEDGAVTMSAERSCTATFIVQPGGGNVALNSDTTADVFAYNVDTGYWARELSSFPAVNFERAFTEASSGWSPAWDVRGGDFNADGRTDFFLYNRTTGQWFKAINTGTDFTYFTSTWSAGWDVRVLKLNGDSLADVFLYNPASGLWFKCVSTGDGTGEFSYALGSWSTGWQIYPLELNADGRADFFLYSGTNGIWFRATNDGAASFTYSSESWSAGWQVFPGDFNADGRSDVFLYNPSSGQWFICPNTGTSFSYVTEFWAPGWTVRIADFDANGRADVFLYNSTSGEWRQAINNGTGSFTYHASIWSPSWQVYIVDFNNDARSDVLLYNTTTGTWFQCLNLTLGTFSYTSGTWFSGLSLVATTPRTP